MILIRHANSPLLSAILSGHIPSNVRVTPPFPTRPRKTSKSDFNTKISCQETGICSLLLTLALFIFRTSKARSLLRNLAGWYSPPHGDFRDWAAIDGWANSIAEALKAP
jgi:hypothetical protein